MAEELELVPATFDAAYGALERRVLARHGVSISSEPEAFHVAIKRGASASQSGTSLLVAWPRSARTAEEVAAAMVVAIFGEDVWIEDPDDLAQDVVPPRPVAAADGTIWTH